MNEMDFQPQEYMSLEEESKSLIQLSAEVMGVGEEQAKALFARSKEMMNTMIGYKELRMRYACAMKEIRTKFDVLNTEFNVLYQRNPIKFIKSRLKTTTSIGDKLDRLDIPFSLANIEKNIHDVAGVRVICAYVDDIYAVAKTLIQQDDIELIARKDYIANPKPNGYRSLHLIVRVPVFFANETRKMTVEVQIRTIAMDFWASLEHQLKYKQEIADEQRIVQELKECADIIAGTDARMLEIRKSLEAATGEQSEEDILLEKLSKFDVPFE